MRFSHLQGKKHTARRGAWQDGVACKDKFKNGDATGTAFQIGSDNICKLLEIWEASLLKLWVELPALGFAGQENNHLKSTTATQNSTIETSWWNEWGKKHLIMIFHLRSIGTLPCQFQQGVPIVSHDIYFRFPGEDRFRQSSEARGITSFRAEELIQ
jgi:hypothetical protein